MNASVRVMCDGPAESVDGTIESAHCFAPGLVGVLAKPQQACGRKTAVILLNAGLVHHVGPFRSYVQLARALAGHGFPVLRFDKSGLGDSPVSKKVTAQRTRGEVKAAIDFMVAETGADRFVIGGICSAADDAFHVAAVEPRISGLLMIDGLAYRTAGYWLRLLGQNVLNMDKFLRFLKRRSAGSPGLEDFRDFPVAQVARQAMRDLVARDNRFLFVFTAGAHRYFNHRGQLAACLGDPARARQVSLEFWPGCDHTFYLQEHRDRLLDTIVEWMRAEFGGDVAADTSHVSPETAG